ncbi:MAG: SapC family protein [Spirochaetes bacterium]|nr:SapC family protein [Spirochaetota bacterium]
MANLLFYGKTVALNKELHKNKKISPPTDNYSFTAKTNSVILTGPEFGNACKELCIVFSRIKNNQIVPVVLLGVRNNENLLLNSSNKWCADYIPGFIRRYPFVLAEASIKDSETLTVCIDESYPGFGVEKGEPLFENNGEYSPFLLNTIQFLKDYHNQFKLTESFTSRLQELDLFKEYTAKFDLKNGQSFRLGEFLIVNEKKLYELEDKQVLELFQAGQLAWIFFHLTSLANMGLLVDVASEKLAKEGD